MGQNNLPMNGIMGFPGIMSNNGNGNGITPQMLQQLSQQQGGNPMLMGGNGIIPFIGKLFCPIFCFYDC